MLESVDPRVGTRCGAAEELQRGIGVGEWSRPLVKPARQPVPRPGVGLGRRLDHHQGPHQVRASGRNLERGVTPHGLTHDDCRLPGE